MSARAPRPAGRLLVIGTGGLALALALLLAGRAWDGDPGRPTGRDASDPATAQAGPATGPGSVDDGAAVSGGARDGPRPASWLASATGAIGAQRTALIDSMHGTHDPHAALRVFDLLEACLDFRNGRSHEADACDGVSDAALADRWDALAAAIQGHAPGAVARLYYASDGDPFDPRREALRKRLEPLLVDAIDHGDIEALSAGLFEYQVGANLRRDPARALVYVTVAIDIERQRGGDTAALAGQAARLATELSDPQRVVALATAERLFVDAYQGKPAQ